MVAQNSNPSRDTQKWFPIVAACVHTTHVVGWPEVIKHDNVVFSFLRRDSAVQ